MSVASPSTRVSATLFAALGDETRLRLVLRLSQQLDPMSISELAKGSDISRQAVTKHLHVLSGAKLIRGVRDGRKQRWSLNPAQLRNARLFLDRVGAEWDSVLDRLKLAVEEKL